MHLMPVFLIMLTVGTSAFAQTAEETVAYLALGIEDGASIDSLGPLKGAPLKLDSASPAIYTSKAKIGAEAIDIKVEVRAIELCAYSAVVTFTAQSGKKAQKSNSYDFSSDVKLVQVSKSGIPVLNASVDKSCAFKLEEKRFDGKVLSECPKEIAVAVGENQIPRAQKAFAHLRANYCKGRAF